MNKDNSQTQIYDQGEQVRLTTTNKKTIEGTLNKVERTDSRSFMFFIGETMYTPNQFQEKITLSGENSSNPLNYALNVTRTVPRISMQEARESAARFGRQVYSHMWLPVNRGKKGAVEFG
ncbi:MAG: hypothetical protein WC238_06230 [Parcubacteria group bacterium]|jgi:hypothetical protein